MRGRLVAIGAVLSGKYRVLAKLGEGGMGVVLRAENLLTGKQVALKCIHPHVAAVEGATERLLREARAASSLNHPNVVDVYDVLRDDDTLCLVMELLQGENLREYLARNPQPKISEFIALMMPALAGVAAAHEAGVLHRDLKPDNIFLERVAGSPTRVAKVLDFGIAKLLAAQGQTLTQTGVALGTPHYMSLEQLRGDKDIDERADVYAFGVILYEAVTGRTPYEAASLSEFAIKAATTDAPAVKSLRPDVPTSFAHIIDWALARDRNRRLPNIATLRNELQIFASAYSFREQMTDQAAVLPSLGAAAAPPPTKGPSPVESKSESGATRPATEPKALDADTPRARERLSTATATATASWQGPAKAFRWALGAGIGGVLLLGSGLFALLHQAPAEPTKALATSPAMTPHAVRPAPLPPPGSAASAPTHGMEPSPTASPVFDALQEQPAAAPSDANERHLLPTAAKLPRQEDTTKPAAKAAAGVRRPSAPRVPQTAPPVPAKKKTSVELVGF